MEVLLSLGILMVEPATPPGAPRDLLDTICTRGRLMLASLDMDLPEPTILMEVPAIPTEAPRDLLDTICTRGRLMLATSDMDLLGPTILMGDPAIPTGAPRDFPGTICTRGRLAIMVMELLVAISMSPDLKSLMVLMFSMLRMFITSNYSFTYKINISHIKKKKKFPPKKKKKKKKKKK